MYWANLTASEKVVINQGGTWSGKSYSILQVLFTIAIMQKNYVITVTSNTLTKLKEDAMRISKEIVRENPFIKSQIADYNATDRTYIFKNGTIIEFKSFQTPEEAKGGKRHILYINEATRIPYMIFWEADLRTSVRTFIDYNPTSHFWVHDRVIREKEEFPSVRVFRSWHVHNPYCPQEMRDRIERIKDPELHKVYARGLTGRLKGTVYSDWVKYDEFNWSEEVLWYVDFGYSEKESADPSAAGRVKEAPGILDLDYAIDELVYSQGISPASIAQVFHDSGYKSGQICYCDHSTEGIRDLRMNGITAVPATKGPGSVLAGILYLKQKRVGYSKRSVNIEEELKRYKFLEVEGIVTNTPVDEWNHHMDGIRYATHSNYLRVGNAA